MISRFFDRLDNLQDWCRRRCHAHWKMILRWVFSLISLWLAVDIGLSIRQEVFPVIQDWEEQRFVQNSLPYNALTKASLDMVLDRAKSLFTYNLVLAGIVWGLVLTKKEGPRIWAGDTPEWGMFVVANALILSNAYCYTKFLWFMNVSILTGGKYFTEHNVTIPDFMDSRIIGILELHETGLIYLLIVVGLNQWSITRIKEVRENSS